MNSNKTHMLMRLCLGACVFVSLFLCAAEPSKIYLCGPTQLTFANIRAIKPGEYERVSFVIEADMRLDGFTLEHPIVGNVVIKTLTITFTGIGIKKETLRRIILYCNKYFRMQRVVFRGFPTSDCDIQYALFMNCDQIEFHSFYSDPLEEHAFVGHLEELKDSGKSITVVTSEGFNGGIKLPVIRGLRYKEDEDR